MNPSTAWAVCDMEGNVLDVHMAEDEARWDATLRRHSAKVMLWEVQILAKDTGAGGLTLG